MRRNREYDPFAWLYTKYWGAEFHEQSLAVLDKLLLHRLSAGARILDLCCGDGRISQQLARRGFRVTGIDASENMLAFARRRAPKVEFLLGDARRFGLPARFDAAVSTFDSLNHVLEGAELLRVFHNVFACLKTPGWFVFDLNREEAYRDIWARTWHTVDKTVASISRGNYDSQSKLAYCDVIQFRRNGQAWERSEYRLSQRFHPIEDVVQNLAKAGFRVEIYDAASDLGMVGEIGSGRTFFLALKE